MLNSVEIFGGLCSTPDGFDFELLLKDLDLIWELRKYIPIGPYR